MTPSERVLLALDAHECWAGVVVRPRVERTVINRGVAAFGMIAGQYSVAELQDLITLWAGRMVNLDTWYGVASPVWVAKDNVAFVAFTNDWNALHARYDTALSSANSAVTVAALSVFTPNSAIAAQPQYDALMKAMRQCYPPDGCPTVKGDWADLYARAAAVSPSLGIAAPPDAPAQPVAVDVDQSLFAATTNLDVVAQVTGAQKGGPLPQGGNTLAFLQWMAAHKTLLLVGGAVIAGGIVLSYVAPMVGLLGKSAHGIAALAA